MKKIAITLLFFIPHALLHGTDRRDLERKPHLMPSEMEHKIEKKLFGKNTERKKWRDIAENQKRKIIILLKELDKKSYGFGTKDYKYHHETFIKYQSEVLLLTELIKRDTWREEDVLLLKDFIERDTWRKEVLLLEGLIAKVQDPKIKEMLKKELQETRAELTENNVREADIQGSPRGIIDGKKFDTVLLEHASKQEKSVPFMEQVQTLKKRVERELQEAEKSNLEREAEKLLQEFKTTSQDGVIVEKSPNVVRLKCDRSTYLVTEYQTIKKTTDENHTTVYLYIDRQFGKKCDHFLKVDPSEGHIYTIIKEKDLDFLQEEPGRFYVPKILSPEENFNIVEKMFNAERSHRELK